MDTVSLTIVTGANGPYARMLWQMLRSAARHGLPARHRFVAFDLGLAPSERAGLAREFPWCLWRELPFDALPPHVPPEQRTFAWKPLAVYAALAEFRGRILWFDSATLFQGPLDEVSAAIARYGIYTLAGQAPLLERCNAEVWQAMQAPLEVLHWPERVGGVVGIDSDHRIACAVARAWRDCALDPRLAHRETAAHRCDQALLSLLIFSRVHAGELTLNPGEIDISCPRPVRWVTTRNKVSPAMPRWADPLARAWFATYKAVDRVGLRLRHFKRTRINGWHRWPKEHFSVFVQRSDAATPTRISAPGGSYYADPFLHRHEGQTWLFVEEFRYPDNSGRLVALPLDHGLRAGAPQTLQLEAGHRSFPFVFSHEGRTFLLPESCAARVIDLYECVEFPTRWKLCRRLLADLDAADTTLIEHAGRWWLFTSIREPHYAGRALAIFHTDDLLRGAWQPHPVNAERRYANEPFSFGRCAGALVSNGGTWLRPIHASRRYYGEAVAWMAIERLTPTEFHERPFAGRHPLADIAAAHGPHHLTTLDDLTAWDVRDRVNYTRTLLGRGRPDVCVGSPRN